MASTDRAADNQTVASIIKLARDSLIRPDAELDSAVASSAQHGLPSIEVTPLQGQLLAIQAQLIGAKSVLEIGTLGGYSTLWFAKTGAKVTSIEFNPKHREVAIENTKGYEVEVLLGAALEVLPTLAAESRIFDFVFIDANWEDQAAYFDWAVKLTRKGGAIYVDNAVRALVRNGTTDASKPSLVTEVGKDERVTASLVPTVFQQHGAEDHVDGFLLAIVK